MRRYPSYLQPGTHTSRRQQGCDGGRAGSAAAGGSKAATEGAQAALQQTAAGLRRKACRQRHSRSSRVVAEGTQAALQQAAARLWRKARRQHCSRHHQPRGTRQKRCTPGRRPAHLLLSWWTSLWRSKCFRHLKVPPCLRAAQQAAAQAPFLGAAGHCRRQQPAGQSDRRAAPISLEARDTVDQGGRHNLVLQARGEGGGTAEPLSGRTMHGGAPSLHVRCARAGPLRLTFFCPISTAVSVRKSSLDR